MTLKPGQETHKIRIVVFTVLILLFAGCTPASEAAQRSSPRIDLRELGKIEQSLSFGGPSGMAVKSVFASVRREIMQHPKSDQRAFLWGMARKTKWGSPQRYTTYYLCAWYGVRYKTCRDYLLNVAYWWERGLEDRYKSQQHRARDTYIPFGHSEDSSVLLYELYEHNHDFKLLHDIVTTESDGAGAEVICSIISQALERHPRGMLHVAELSKKGHDLAVKLLKCSAADYDNDTFIMMLDPSSVQVFMTYVGRIASDAADPLSKLARRLQNAPYSPNRTQDNKPMPHP